MFSQCLRVRKLSAQGLRAWKLLTQCLRVRKPLGRFLSDFRRRQRCLERGSNILLERRSDWWERAGTPTTGLLFAARRSENAGSGPKVGVSHAVAFRRDVRRAFGVHVWDAETRRFARPEDRELSPRERELFEDTPFTRQSNSTAGGRAYSQALANVGASAQQASNLAGHASLDAHQRYLNNTAKMAEAPAAALPAIRVLPQLVAKTPRLKGKRTKEKSPVLAGLFRLLRGEDLNLRPSGYEPDELPGCSTARQGGVKYSRRMNCQALRNVL